jgi:hypothetical protein
MASRTKNRRHRAPHRTYVAPVLDPTWENPYQPTAQERAHHERVVISLARRRQRGLFLGGAVAVLVSVVGAFALNPLAGLGILLGAGLVAWGWRRAQHDARSEAQVRALFADLSRGGSTKDDARLSVIVDRLMGTFGMDNVTAIVVKDATFNAALVPSDIGYVLFATDSLMSSFDLIEIEGVVAHLFARVRLGVVTRAALATVWETEEFTQQLFPEGITVRVDEVAAASIRSPQGIAGALRRCAAQGAARGLASSPLYARTRSLWFDVRSDRAAGNLSDLDDPTLRAMALEEW